MSRKNIGGNGIGCEFPASHLARLMRCIYHFDKLILTNVTSKLIRLGIVIAGAHIFGIMPIVGVRAWRNGVPTFKWLSVRTILCLLTMLLGSIVVYMYMHRLHQAGYTAKNLGWSLIFMSLIIIFSTPNAFQAVLSFSYSVLLWQCSFYAWLANGKYWWNIGIKLIRYLLTLLTRFMVSGCLRKFEPQLFSSFVWLYVCWAYFLINIIKYIPLHYT